MTVSFRPSAFCFRKLRFVLHVKLFRSLLISPLPYFKFDSAKLGPACCRRAREPRCFASEDENPVTWGARGPKKSVARADRGPSEIFSPINLFRCV